MNVTSINGGNSNYRNKQSVNKQPAFGAALVDYEGCEKCAEDLVEGLSTILFKEKNGILIGDMHSKTLDPSLGDIKLFIFTIKNKLHIYASSPADADDCASVALNISKKLKKNPIELANKIIEKMRTAIENYDKKHTEKL
jgi:hypothetical protein